MQTQTYQWAVQSFERRKKQIVEVVHQWRTKCARVGGQSQTPGQRGGSSSECFNQQGKVVWKTIPFFLNTFLFAVVIYCF